MVKIRRRYPVSFQRKVARAVKKGKTAAQVAAIFRVSLRSVRNWVNKFRKGKKKSKDPIKRRKFYPDNVKKKAVAALEEGVSAAEVAKTCGASTRTIYEWYDAAHPERLATGRIVTQEEMQRAEERLRRADAERAEARIASQRVEMEQIRAEGEEKLRVREMLADPLKWMQRYTKTKDSHWREHGADSPYRRFPEMPYFPPLVEGFQTKPTIFVEKSRDMMLSWLFVGLFTHAAMTTPGIEVLFQSQKQEKANELIEYAKILYEHSEEAIRKSYPLSKKTQAAETLEFAHGSRIIAIPGGGDQIRSYHPWGLLMDEAAFMPEAGDAFDNAVPVCKKIVALSSAGPGWFADICNAGVPVSTTKDTKGHQGF